MLPIMPHIINKNIFICIITSNSNKIKNIRMFRRYPAPGSYDICAAFQDAPLTC
jgi:hypothetical protein